MNPNSLQTDRAVALQKLHASSDIFVIPNPWDAGSAKILASLGFKALATTSAGLAFSIGKPDGEGVVNLKDALDNVRSIAAATSLPLSADLENGYGDSPDACASAILLAAEAGAVGGSIEDATGRRNDPIYSLELAVDRVKAAVAAARSLPFPFTLTARAENLIHGRADLPDTIRRLVAFAEAGADVLFAPGLTTREEIIAVVNAVAPKPVNVVMGLSKGSFTLEELASLGVRRVSLGSSLSRVAYGAFLTAAQDIYQKGTFSFPQDTVPYADLNALFRSA
ncbi:isocitrate lyase/phosphoenolpyruvate mutase family protein [Flavitalea sp. BT771]|uniref:isocitrate lyase/PEP mutase family protein n=1 Tax=Flavitalea sp. BT771 TaxID=3063329 RepID=UPI0026E3287F|nr:isocitrate lyase/phosphoenolpyruvate mutase family protein [Flavitalea sp. BT771]MDO6429117.1 isocitrate lyase/phosphoenolpyruvate mutase family protein [Flavitalea sp. BT771]MDV6218755.1 isocitrate lyase/phosphoenolpyruvate mutase family protein [Flavitalea sp. BT771]